MEIWNEFCSYLIDCKERDVSEERYHEIIESQLSVLGWKRYKGEICHKERIPSGHGFAEPDIVVKKDGVNQMVIEVKKPNHLQTKEERLQLLSYMRLCTLRIGIYIGEHIEIFYDVQGDSIEPVSIYRVPISLNEKRGQQFVELIRRDNFDKDRFMGFCEAQLQEQKKRESLDLLKKNLLDGRYNSFLKNSLKQKILEDESLPVSEEQIDDLLCKFQIKVVSEEDVIEQSEINSTLYAPVTSYNNTNATARDNTRYSLDGSAFLPKGRFVLAVVSKYARLHPDKSYNEILAVFPDNLGVTVVIKQLNQISPKQIKDRRFFTSPNELLCSADGIQYAVTTQWNITTIPNIVNVAKSLGWDVKASK